MKDRMTDMEEIQQEVAQDIVETMEQAEPEAQGTEKDAPVRNRYAGP